MRFWDSSAIVPLLLTEAESSLVADILEADPTVVVWWATPVDCASALARREREGALDIRAAGAAYGILRELGRSWTEILPSDSLRATAQRLLRVHPLRATDSMQLAAALVATEGRPAGTDLVRLDRRLAEAATREGFAVSPTL